MIVYRLYVDVSDLEDAQWLFTTLEIAKASAEEATRQNVELLSDVQLEYVWKQEQEIRPTQESVTKGEKSPLVDIEAWKLYYRTSGIPEMETAYIVEAVEVYETVNF